jgi:nucleoside phosphorylase
MVAIQETSDDRWKEYLVDKITYASRATATRQVSVYQHYSYDALIVTALDTEFQPYRQSLDLNEIPQFPGAHEFLFRDDKHIMRRGIAFSIGKSGQARAASATQSLLHYFRPRVALMSGFCGGMKSKAALGELLIFETTYDWDYGKWIETAVTSGAAEMKSVFVSRPLPITIDGSEFHRKAREFVRSDFTRQPQFVDEVKQRSFGDIQSVDVHLGPAASGSAVVANDFIISHIRNLNDALRGVDMESYGFYYACSQTKVIRPHFACLKSVADFCDGQKGDKFHSVCGFISASASLRLLQGWQY